jgi:small-conductance mechanosensitive channel
VTIGYDVPWPKVQKLLLAAASNTTDIEQEPKPFVLQTSLDDNYVAYELNAFTRRADKRPRIYSELHANILDSFHGAGVEITSPHYRATRDGNEPAMAPVIAAETDQNL